MEVNMGNTDRLVRIAVGLLLLTLVFVGPQTLWGWLGGVVVLIALFGFCPLYKVLGFSTCKSCES
ncbi:MAG: DUF2892 domain-containing protein [Motiliproteus sp.]|nr:DUF2892 domain-containing protein [Motiliproteus sp.]MCW9054225.1 DUF2892 domain-containing protein [Motiliproteus sp.]